MSEPEIKEVVDKFEAVRKASNHQTILNALRGEKSNTFALVATPETRWGYIVRALTSFINARSLLEKHRDLFSTSHRETIMNSTFWTRVTVLRDGLKPLVKSIDSAQETSCSQPDALIEMLQSTEQVCRANWNTFPCLVEDEDGNAE